MTHGVAVLATSFEPPSTKDFVFGCWGGSFGFDFCFNFITVEVILTLVIVLALFFFAFRKPSVVPGKLQAMMELGIQFVREQIAIPVLGADADRFMPLLASLFFFILIGNMFEVVPGVNFSANSRVAFPLIFAVISWVTYNVVGVKKHGFLGYLKHTCIIGEAPAILRYSLLMVIEFVSNIVIRPITLTVRLTANFLAGHFLLAIFFLGTIFFLKDGPKTWILVGVSFPFAIILVGFEIFVAVLQAFIFAVLTGSYIGGALAEGH
ncbi:MAG: F0F1 ATP synthase subunit A [Actinomycetota bacterium]|nr:F0F1 ATP synthase subunit A [Actinomycetota bacterium]